MVRGGSGYVPYIRVGGASNVSSLTSFCPRNTNKSTRVVVIPPSRQTDSSCPCPLSTISSKYGRLVRMALVWTSKRTIMRLPRGGITLNSNPEHRSLSLNRTSPFRGRRSAKLPSSQPAGSWSMTSFLVCNITVAHDCTLISRTSLEHNLSVQGILVSHMQGSFQPLLNSDYLFV